MFNLKMKKLSIIAGVVASTITLSTFSGFATGLPTESLAEQIIGISNEVSPSSEQKVDDSVNLHKDSANEKIIEDALPQVIDLDKPGDYRLIGAQAASTSKNQDPNEIIVNTHDRIVIDGDGNYNITLDNVHIDIDDQDGSPISASENANVNLILVGKNYLKNRSDRWEAALKVKSSLTIGASGEGASLDVYGLYRAIYGRNITIDGGNINATSEKSKAIYGDELTINGGYIEATSEKGNAIIEGYITIKGGDIKATTVNNNAIQGCNIKIYGGDVKATSEKGCAICVSTVKINEGKIEATSVEGHAINVTYIKINGGKIKANSQDGVAINGEEMTITGGEIEANSQNDTTIRGSRLTINNGNINANNDKGSAIYGYILTINGGDIKANSENCFAFFSTDITINGGNIKATSVDNIAIYSKDTLTINDGKVTANSINAGDALEMNKGIFDISEIESKNITINSGDISKIKCINGRKYDFENSEYTLPFYLVYTKGKHINNENKILENLWGTFKKSNTSEAYNYFSDCRLICRSEN